MKTKHKLKFIRFVPTLAATLALSAWSPVIVGAQDYLGASNVLRQVEERNASPAAKREKDASAQLRDDLKSFRESVTNLAPADAAQRWLDLVDRAVKVQHQQMQNYNPSVIRFSPMIYWGRCPRRTRGAHWPRLSPRVLRPRAARKSGKADYVCWRRC
jgi:hypothetical protein